MRRSIVCIIFSLCHFCLLGQQKLDTLFYLNGNKEIAAISKITPDSVEYCFPNETLINIANTKELVSIHLASGRIIFYEQGRRIATPTEIKTKVDYPESYTAEIGANSITMILVEGGVFEMGYDDRHSLRLDSEPVHPVRVTPFYISKEFITKGIVSYCNGNKDQQNNNPVAMKWEGANKITEIIAKNTGIPYRLPTEAEWEYSATSSQKEVLFEKYKGGSLMELCLDFFDYYPSPEEGMKIDPTGPKEGKRHVVRCFSNDSYYLYNRATSSDRGYFRIAVKADSVFPSQKD